MIEFISKEEFDKVSEQNLKKKETVFDIIDFMQSSTDVAEIKNNNFKHPESCACSYRYHVKHLGYDCKVMLRGGRVFLVKKEP